MPCLLRRSMRGSRNALRRAVSPRMEAPGLVIDYWFGACGPDGAFETARLSRWFDEGRRHDDEILARFGTLHGQAVGGALDDWPPTPEGRLALILVLDQMSRHIGRDTPAAFANDSTAQRLTLDGLEMGADQALMPIQRMFFYLPLEHAEDRSLQARSVECYRELATDVAPVWRSYYDEFLDYAERHLDVIERFGRFPDLNPILGRDTTPDEARFLRQPGSSFL